MTAVKVTCLVISCDRCGSRLGQHSEGMTIHIHEGEDYTDSDLWGEERWRKAGDRDLCPNCWTYGDPPGDDPEAEAVIVELPHPLSGRVGA